MNQEILKQAKEVETIESILKKMVCLLQQNEYIQKQWSDPNKWWNK